jgi:hypothetical protein
MVRTFGGSLRLRQQETRIAMITIANWIEARSRWSQLRQLGNSNLVRASVLMPAFGYMLLLNENIHQYLTVKYDSWLLTRLHLPNLWRIWLLFYGSFSLATATILYSVFCPEEVKRYNSSFEMADEETDHQINLGQFEIVQDALRGFYSRLSAWEQMISPQKPRSLEMPLSDLSNRRSAMSVYLIHQWTLKNLKRPRLRSLIFLLFALGLILVGVPAVLTFVQVTWLAVSHLLY